jgi:Flp pilus assembly protein TadD
MPSIRIEHNHESVAVDPTILAAWQAYRNGELDTAFHQYSEVLQKNILEHNSPNRDALLGLAAIAQQRLQDSIAVQYYSQLLTLDPDDPDALAGMSSVARVDGSAEAVSRLKHQLAQHPETAALHFALGNQYAEQSRWGEAAQAYFIAKKLEPNNAPFTFNLAVSLDHLGQNKLAVQRYQQALQMDRAHSNGIDHAQVQLRVDEILMHP